VAPPGGESLRRVAARLLPYWYGSIVPDLRTNECVLVISHGNTLRALIKHLDEMGDEEWSCEALLRSCRRSRLQCLSLRVPARSRAFWLGSHFL
jgi:broad specificity phosphatase PhoE